MEKPPTLEPHKTSEKTPEEVARQEVREQPEEYVEGVQEALEKITKALEKKSRAEQQLAMLESRQPEMSSDEYEFKKKILETTIFSTDGEIRSTKEHVSLADIEAFRSEKDRGLVEEKKSAENLRDKKFVSDAAELFTVLDTVVEKITTAGYDPQKIGSEFLEEGEEKEFFQNLEKEFKLDQVGEKISQLKAENLELLLDSMKKMKSSLFSKYFIEEALDRGDIDTYKIVDKAFRFVLDSERDEELIYRIKDRLSIDKQEAIKQLPIDDMLDMWEKELPDAKGWTGLISIEQKLIDKFTLLQSQKDKEGLEEFSRRLAALREKTNQVPSFYDAYPKWLKKMNLNEKDSINLASSKMSEETFRYYFEQSGQFIPFGCVPESFSPEEKKKYYSRVFFSEDLSMEQVKEYARLTDTTVFRTIAEHPLAVATFFKNKKSVAELRKQKELLYQEFDEKSESSVIRMDSIMDSFLVRDTRSELPVVIQEVLQHFEDRFGTKGRDLVALAVATYGTKNLERFNAEMQNIEQVLSKYNPETIPEYAKVSMGIEYEVTHSIESEYNKDSLMGYKNDITIVSDSANIAKGRDAVHEIALRPNYNPYMLMAEMKLLQDAQFLDLNFEKYPNASRGYHLSLVGNTGLYVDENMSFLQNVMTMAQLTGITAGKLVEKTSAIHGKDFEMFVDSAQGGKRCEIKGMATDSVEQFEKSILTSHYAGIAIQLCNKYLGKIKELETVPHRGEVFEQTLLSNDMLLTPFETNQDRDIVHNWMQLRSSIIEAIEQHNDSFIDSEFNGYVMNKEGEYVDTSEQIDSMRNKKLVEPGVLQSEEFKDSLQIQKEHLFKYQQPEFVNALTRVNNIFLKSPQKNKEGAPNQERIPKSVENSSVNAKAVLDTVKHQGSSEILEGSATESLFDNGGIIRDGYYYTQGASEEMILHKSQILLNTFNKNMEQALSKKGVPRTAEAVVA